MGGEDVRNHRNVSDHSTHQDSSQCNTEQDRELRHPHKPKDPQYHDNVERVDQKAVDHLGADLHMRCHRKRTADPDLSALPAHGRRPHA